MASVHVVGVADCKFSKNPSDTVVTYALGSCIGLALYDPSAKVGGILHLMLPDSNLRSRARDFNPYMYADSGLDAFLKGTANLGAQKKRLVAKVVGGSNMLRHSEVLDIGKRNANAVLHLLAKEGIPVAATRLGGTVGRSMELRLEDGGVLVKTLGRGQERL